MKIKTLVAYAFPLFMVILVFIHLNWIGNSLNDLTVLLQYTARISFLTFALAFASSTINVLLNSRLSGWLLIHRRELGIAFALIHFLHLGILILKETQYGSAFSESSWPSLIGGIFTYTFIGLMLITSYPVFSKRLSKKTWKTIHLLGGYTILIAFSVAYIRYTLEDLLFLPFLLIALGIWFIRIWRLSCRKLVVQGFIIFLFLHVSCTKQKIQEHETLPELQYTFLKDEKKINSSISGVWKSIGNGYYLDARYDSIQLFSYTDNFCYKEKNDYLEGLLNSQSKFLLNQDSLHIYLTDYGEDTRSLQPNRVFVKVDELPETCLSFDELLNLLPRDLLQIYLETFEENYAFLERRNVNWDSIRNFYQEVEIPDMESLFEEMGKIATSTKDHHTKVINKKGNTRQFRGVPSAKLVTKVFEEQSKITDLNEFFGLFFETNYKNISDSLLSGNGTKALNNKLEWGSLNEEIGYLNIHSFAGFSSNGISRKHQIDSLNFFMTEIINSFQDKEAIIVDVGFNFGGFDASGLTIAGYFTDSPVLAYYHEVFSDGHFYTEDSVLVIPNETINFTKPVYLLMTDISRSAAESFALMMGSLPNVKLVGTPTLGIQSGMLGKSIGDFYTTLSNQRLVDTGGNYYEARGVQPEIELEIFKGDNLFQSHMEAVKKVVNIIEKENEMN